MVAAQLLEMGLHPAGLFPVQEYPADAGSGAVKVPSVADFQVVVQGRLLLVFVLRDPAQVVVGVIRPLLVLQHLPQVGLGGEVVADLPVDQRQGQQQVAVPGGLGGENLELFPCGLHVRARQQPGVLQAQVAIVGRGFQGRLQSLERLPGPLGLQQLGLQQHCLGLVGLLCEQQAELVQGLLILAQFVVQQGLGQEHLRIVGKFGGQPVDRADQLCLVPRGQLLEAVQEDRKTGLAAGPRNHRQVGGRLHIAAAPHQQDRQGVVGLGIVRRQLDPQLHRFQGIVLALQELGQVGGVSADAGIPQDRGLVQVVVQGHVVGAPPQGEFGHQQGVDAVLGEGPFGGLLLHFHGDLGRGGLGCGGRRIHGLNRGLGGAGGQQQRQDGKEQTGHRGTKFQRVTTANDDTEGQRNPPGPKRLFRAVTPTCNFASNLLKSEAILGRYGILFPFFRAPGRGVRNRRTEGSSPTMNLIALGINHNSAAVEVRERVAFAPEQVSEALVDACSALDLAEVVILSTCNRTEIYAVPRAEVALEQKAGQLIDWMANYHHLPAPELREFAYHFEAREALQHIVQVASGLDSMVLGEPQIFGQMKSAYAVASDAGTVGAELGRLFPRAFSISKQVRTDTAIGENPVSVAYAAVDLAGHIFADLRQCSALLVGAGETIELVARHLIDAGVQRIVIANRTLGRARELGQRFGAEAVLLAEIPEQLPSADIVITSTASQLPILGKGAVEDAIKARKHRPMLMVDIAVPRDIEAQVGELRDVYLYSVDDLREIVDQNLRNRQSEARRADTIITEGVGQYLEEKRSLAAVDTVKEYRRMAERLRERELKGALRALDRGEDPQAVMARLARSLTNKLIHAPTTGLKRASAKGRQDQLRSARRLLGLEMEVESAGTGDRGARSDQDNRSDSAAGADTGDSLAAEDGPRPTLQ